MLTPRPELTPLSLPDAVGRVAAEEAGDVAEVLIDMLQRGDIAASTTPAGELHFRLTGQGAAAARTIVQSLNQVVINRAAREEGGTGG